LIRPALAVAAAILVCASAFAADFEVYHGGDGLLAARFEYPAGWKARKGSGRLDRFDQVLILGPRNADDTYTTALVVTASPPKAKGGRFAGAREAAEHQVATLPSGGQTVARSAARVDGAGAVDVTVRYVIPPLRLKGLKPKEIPVRTRSAYFEKGGRIFELSYTADEREFDAHAAAFDRLVATFRAA
jgi:hypothetical protein